MLHVVVHFGKEDLEEGALEAGALEGWFPVMLVDRYALPAHQDGWFPLLLVHCV